jgi:DNA-binding NtrC family response regulator
VGVGLEFVVAQRSIALINAHHADCHLLQDLLGPEVELVLLSPGEIERACLSKVCLFLVGNSGGDPSSVIAIIRRLRELRASAPVFLIAWASSEQLAVLALKEGVADYFLPPIQLRDVADAASKIVLQSPPPPQEWIPTGCYHPDRSVRPIIGESVVMKSLRSWLLRVAQRDCNTLILGETGTGKDLIAEAIHANSPRRKKPFVSVNCAAIPDTLLESELFGYERGAFTGANSTTVGKIQQAHEGTIFFDEIGEMTPSAQAKILRVMESKQIQRLGGKAIIPVDVRIVAATNQDLSRLVSEQLFRKDLYFRLNVARIHLPPLRERRGDIRSLLEYYLQMFNRQTGASVEGFTREALEWLVGYDWPGNVRELKNSVESVFIDPPHSRIDLCHLCINDLCRAGGEEGERDQLLDALQSTQWNKSRAAEKLQWSRMKIYRKITKYKIEDREGCPNDPAGVSRVVVK